MAKSVTRIPPQGLLKPYLATTLFCSQNVNDAALRTDLIDQAIKILSDPHRTLIETFRPIKLDGLTVGAFVYVHKRLASWANDEFYDETWELVVVAVKAGLIGICCSETSARDRVVRQLKRCAPLPRKMLERAFVGTHATAMWLNGTHTPTASKANAKAMTGPALEMALDPLGDQSFFYSAVKSRGTYAQGITVGTAPSASRVWINRPADWKTFGQNLEAVLDHYRKIEGSNTTPEAWLKVLAQDLGHIGKATVPYEVALIAPELLSDAEIDPSQRERALAWGNDGKFEIIEHEGPSPTCQVSLGGKKIGKVKLRLEMVADRAVATASWTCKAPGADDDIEACSALIERPDCLRIYYENGNTLAEGRLFNPAYRDQSFNWCFEDFTGYVVTDEKPKKWGEKTLASVIAAPKENGSKDDSLFAFVVEKLFPEGWLASDDGSMEIADFVHIDPTSLEVTLIHVKASDKDDPDRQVSVANYEVVVSQAIKNLRHLDRVNLATVLEAGQSRKNIESAVWLNGIKQKNRTGLIKISKKIRPYHEKTVIILQPQLTRKEENNCLSPRTEASNNRVIRMKQLNTLMLSAQLSCGAVGAKFKGIGAK